jgi:hypothetical protein
MKLTVVLFMLCSLCHAQVNRVFEVIHKKSDVTLTSDNTPKARSNALEIITAYTSGADLKALIDGFENEWFDDVDVFLGDDLKSVLSAIESCSNGFYLQHKGKVAIDVSETEEICLVTIYTIP